MPCFSSSITKFNISSSSKGILPFKMFMSCLMSFGVLSLIVSSIVFVSSSFLKLWLNRFFPKIDALPVYIKVISNLESKVLLFYVCRVDENFMLAAVEVKY